MKKNIHPAYYPDATITCSCGNVIQAGSTVKELRTELCSACHPFYTGKSKLVDTEGRVDRFKAKLKKAEEIKAKKETDKAERKKIAAEKAMPAKKVKKAAKKKK